MGQPIDESWLEPILLELPFQRIERERIKALLVDLHGQYLESLPLAKLLARSAAFEAEQIAHTIDLSQTRESIVPMLVRFYEDQLRGLSDEVLIKLLPTSD